MVQQTDPYRIRFARPDEVPRLREIEDEAGTTFSGLGLIDEALDVSFPLDDLARLVGTGQRSGRRACGRSARRRRSTAPVSRRGCSFAASWGGVGPVT